MKFTVNMQTLSNSFPFPKSVAEKNLKLASKAQLEVLIYTFAHLSDGIDAEDFSKNLGMSVSDVEEALLFWVQNGVLNRDGQEAKKEKKQPVLKGDLPTREDVVSRGLEDKNIMLLLREAQLKFGRNLKVNESALLVSLYDDNGMKVSVILMLLQYAAECEKCNLSFIRQTAARWIKEDVQTVEDAERIINREAKEDLAWKNVQKIFGIEKRKPSEKEKELSNLWINEWKMSDELLKAAYDVCVDNKSKVSFSYIAAILESWHKNGVKSKEDTVQNKSRKSGNKNDYGGFDYDLFYEMTNKD